MRREWRRGKQKIHKAVMERPMNEKVNGLCSAVVGFVIEGVDAMLLITGRDIS